MIHLANHGPAAFSGWRRLNCDALPPLDCGVNPVGWRFVVGRQTSLDTHAVDLWVPDMAPGQKVELDLESFHEAERPVPALPLDVIGWFGGLPSVNGTPLGFVTLAIDGAAITAQFRGRVGRLLVVDFWIVWYPNQPWAQCKVLVTASNPTVPDLTEVLASDLMFSFGDAIPLILGQGRPGLLVAAGTQFGDGQSRLLPLTLLWLRHVTRQQQLDAFRVDAVMGMGQVGINRLWPTGNPKDPADFNPLAWAGSQLSRWLADLHQWPSLAGPSPDSTVTGEQTFDQVFVRGEGLLPGGCGAEIGAYLGACKMANRPCHHRESDGSPLNPALHTARPLIFWHGRPHTGLWNIVDRLGKPRAINWDEQLGRVMPGMPETSGWQGPDVEHWLMGTLMAGARLSACEALQSLLRAQATVYMAQQTIVQGWSTSQAYASRAVGYEGLNAVLLWRGLEDRTLAERVKTHWLSRWNLVIKPDLAGKTFWPDGFLGQGKVSLWQQSVGAYGVWLAGITFGVTEAIDIAYNGARAAIEYGFDLDLSDKWVSHSTNLLPGGEPDPIATDIFRYLGFPMAAWMTRSTSLSAVWDQLNTEHLLTKHLQWWPPTEGG